MITQSCFSSGQVQKPKRAHLQVQAAVRELILSGKLAPGDRIPSTRELAELWQVHVPAVHAGLTALVKEGLLERVPGRGTFVRQREAKLTCVGIYHTEERWAKGASDFERALHGALTDELDRLKLRTRTLIDSRPAVAGGTMWGELLQAAQRREIQGLVVTGTDWPHFHWLNKLPIPVAYLTSRNIANEVRVDLQQLAELSLRTLARQGCRSVGLINPLPVAFTHPDGSPHDAGSFYARFADLAGDLGLRVRNEWMRVGRAAAPVWGTLAQQQFGHEEFRQLWAEPERPDGVVVYPDTVARGVILGLLEKQVRVPADLKLVLQKNEAVGLYCPVPATFAVLREREVARALIAQVQKQFRGEPVESVRCPFHLADPEASAAKRPLGRGIPKTPKKRSGGI